MYRSRSHDFLTHSRPVGTPATRVERFKVTRDASHSDRSMTWARSLPNVRPSQRNAAVMAQDLPLLPIQQALLAESLSRPSAGINVEQIVLRYAANAPKAAALNAAWAAAADRFDALRLIIRPKDDGTLHQTLLSSVKLRARHLNWRDLSQTDARLQDWLAQDRSAGFDLTGGPLWRLTCLHLAGGALVVVWTIHHAIIDLSGMARVLDDIGTRLQGQLPDTHADAGLVDVTTQLLAPDPAPMLAQYARHLAGFDSPNRFSSDPADPSTAHLLTRLSLGAQVRLHLERRAQLAGATITNMIQLAFGLALARWTGQDRATFGLTQAVWASVPAARHAAGCLIATTPFHQHLCAQTTLGAHLRDLRRDTLAHRAHMALPLGRIRAACGMAADVQVFDAVLSVAPAALGDLLRAPHWANVTVTLLEQGAAGVTLAVHLDPALELVLEHNPACLSREQGARFLGHVAKLLAQMAQAGCDTPLGDLDMLGTAERATLLARAQPDQTLIADVPCIVTRLARMAAQHPDATALVCAGTGRSISYGVLQRQSHWIARALAARNLGEGAIIALDLPRGPEFVAAMLGVLTVGAAFLPLDAGQDVTLKAGLIAQSGAALVLDDRLLGPDWPLGQSCLFGPDCQLGPDWMRAPDAPPVLLAPRADRRAYVIFTSGSTGKPKGVMGSCGALSAHADAFALSFGLRAQDRCLSFAGLAFDVMLEEILPSLLVGATVVLRDDAAAQSLSSFRALVARHKVSVLNLPASFWHVLEADMASGGPALPASVRLVVTGSERINPAALARWQQRQPQIAWANGYGPTEATITAVTHHLPPHADPVDPSQDVPIGRPMAHAHCHVRAVDGTLAPDGAEGLLWIGGPAVTLGYLDNPTDTARVFQPDPFAPAGQIYATGDRARWDDTGRLRFLGRRDRQVKLRGHRIDLTGVERVLTALPGVQQAHVALDRAGTAQARLLAWLVADPSATAPDLRYLRALAARDLPFVAIPTLMLVDRLPVTANGKVAVAQLPRPDLVSPRRVAQADPMAEKIAALMAQVLGLDAVGQDDDFHDLGGESLAAVRFASLVEQQMNRAVAAMDLYKHPTPASFAGFLRDGSTGPRYIVPIQPDGTQPAFFAVHVLGPKEAQWRPLAQALGPDWPVFGITVGAPRSLDDIDIPTIAEQYFQEIQTHHPTGPLMLGATSMASYYAYDLAQRLIAAGRDVRLVVAFDAMGPGGRPALTGWAKLRAHLVQLARHGTGHLRAIRTARALRRQIARDGAKSTEGAVTGFNIVETTAQAVERYQPAPMPAPLLVLRADTSFWDSPQALDTCLGWSQVAQGGICMVDVPGEHLTILEPGNVAVLAERLKQVVAQQGRS